MSGARAIISTDTWFYDQCQMATSISLQSIEKILYYFRDYVYSRLSKIWIVENKRTRRQCSHSNSVTYLFILHTDLRYTWVVVSSFACAYLREIACDNERVGSRVVMIIHDISVVYSCQAQYAPTAQRILLYLRLCSLVFLISAFS